MKILMAEYLEYNSAFKVGSHHYAEQFGKDNKVLWLSPVYNRLYYYKNKELYEQRKALHHSDLIQLKKNIYGYAPHSLILYGRIPLLDTKLVNKLSLSTTTPNLLKVLTKNDFHNVDVLWLTNIKYYYLTEMISYKKLIYRCADNIKSFNNACKTMPYFEKLIIKKADAVFVTAHSLIEKKKDIRKDLIYLPNGVQLDNFIRDRYEIPHEFENNNKIKCIYVGAIEEWFDLDLVKYCAENLNNIDFYLIGPAKIDMSKLKKLENVFVLGKRNYKDVPNYLYYSDVAIIPFKVNELTDSITPIKLYEYMSVGLNVVSTNFKEINYMNSPAYIAKNYKEFCEDIIEAVQNKEKNQERNIEFAKENTWEKRFDEIKKCI